ncbi:hypothetical protein HK098_000506 [Nowakowskiella sp. JEL0407]|nr:hypothetical protein HK098_000506 [Nowakowskiella sp. JEL0407]
MTEEQLIVKRQKNVSNCTTFGITLYILSFIVMFAVELLPPLFPYSYYNLFYTYLWIASLAMFGIACLLFVVAGILHFLLPHDDQLEYFPRWFFIIGAACITFGILNSSIPILSGQKIQYYGFNPLSVVGIVMLSVWGVAFILIMFRESFLKVKEFIVNQFRSSNIRSTSNHAHSAIIDINVDPEIVHVKVLMKEVVLTADQVGGNAYRLEETRFKVFYGQSYQIVDTKVNNFTYQIEVRSKEYHPFLIVSTWQVGPNRKDYNAFISYMKHTGGRSADSKKVEDLIKGVIFGKCEEFFPKYPLRDIVRSDSEFRTELKLVVQRELDNFGLVFYNPSMTPKDLPGKTHIDRLNKEAIEMAKREDFHSEAETRKFVAVEGKSATMVELKSKSETAEEELKNALNTEKLKNTAEQVKYLEQRERKGSEFQHGLKMKMLEHQLDMQIRRDNADVDRYSSEQRARGIEAIAPAERFRIENMREAFGENSSVTVTEVMEMQKLNDGRHEKMAMIGVAANAVSSEREMIILPSSSSISVRDESDSEEED